MFLDFLDYFLALFAKEQIISPWTALTMVSVITFKSSNRYTLTLVKKSSQFDYPYISDHTR